MNGIVPKADEKSNGGYFPITSSENSSASSPINRQHFVDDSIHRWYNFILGYSDQFVGAVLDHFDVKPGHLVLDAFCGTGTTLVECRKRGIRSVGIDASPLGCFVSRVKTDASLTSEQIESLLPQVRTRYLRRLRSSARYLAEGTFQYLERSGMLDRGWISEVPLRKAICLKRAITSSVSPGIVRDALLLALVSDLPKKIANMKFGPEIYCGKPKADVDVWSVFESGARRMIDDLRAYAKKDKNDALVIEGDSRNCNSLLVSHEVEGIDFAICSPPYPTEHDYTRNTRLELAFLDMVSSKACVRTIKESMIRSHTKGLYKADTDGMLLPKNSTISILSAQIEEKCKGKTHGFARLYPRVVEEYFGGMRRHMSELFKALKPGGAAAFVVGDQASYVGVSVPTADLLRELANEIGFEAEEPLLWRQRWVTKTSKTIDENVLVIRRPQ